MTNPPLRTTVIGSYPLPAWLEYACQDLAQFGEADREELKGDAVLAAVHDQVAAGLDVITDGEQTRLDFNLSFYGFLEGIALETAPPRRFGPPVNFGRRAALEWWASLSGYGNWHPPGRSSNRVSLARIR
jgi:5-methyltetrahydropteroyltriglutamate--homocysteine methyltransferase